MRDSSLYSLSFALVITEAFTNKLTLQGQEATSASNCLSLVVGISQITAVRSASLFSQPTTLFSAQAATNIGVSELEYFVAEHHLQGQYARISVMLHTPDFTLLPAAFSGSAAQQALKFATGKTAPRHLIQHLNGLDVVAGVEMDTISAIEKLFPAAQIRSAAGVSIGLLLEHPALSNTDVFLVLGDRSLELCAKNEKGLLFYNAFQPQTDEDVLYYLLFAMEQFSLSPLHTRLAIAAERPTNDALFKSIAKYVRQVKFCSSHTGIQFTGDFLQMPSHYYFQALNQHLCA